MRLVVRGASSWNEVSLSCLSMDRGKAALLTEITAMVGHDVRDLSSVW